VVRKVVTDGSFGVAYLVERRARNRTDATPWFDSRCGSASLFPRETLYVILGPSSLPVVVA